MRAYFFGNMYLSSIQQGIQSAHVVAEMANKYRRPSRMRSVFFEWADKYKTMILLNGGYASELIRLENLFKRGDYPWASFREEKDALNESITSVGIILPERLYEAAKQKRENPDAAWWTFGITAPIDELVGDELNNFGLAH